MKGKKNTSAYDKKIDAITKKVLQLCETDANPFLPILNNESKLDYLLKAVKFLEKKTFAARPAQEPPGRQQQDEASGRIETLSQVLEATNRKLTEEMIAKRKTEEELIRDAEKFRQIIENSPDVIYTCNENGYFTYINRACRGLTGYPREYFSGRHFTELVMPEWRKRVAEFYREQFNQRVSRTLFSFPVLTRSGRERWVEQTVRQVMLGGRITEYQAIVRDITERKAVNDVLRNNAVKIEELNKSLTENVEQLETANSELKSFSYTISHDLRTPLRAINSYARIIIEDYGSQLDGKVVETMEKITSNAIRMGQLIDQLLAFSNLGRKEIRRQAVDLNALVREVIEVLREIKPFKNVTLKIGKLPDIKCDYTLIREVYINLISNAIKFSSSRKRAVVEIGSYEKDKKIVFYVKDNGVGFDMKYCDKLFGVFQKLHQVQEFEGVGAGLAIVKRIIEKHGGEVWAEGKVNKGAAFFFCLEKIKKK